MSNHFYTAAFWLILIGALVVETFPLVAIGMIAAAGLCVRLAESIKKRCSRCSNTESSLIPHCKAEGTGAPSGYRTHC